jgi:hypothetical protein
MDRDSVARLRFDRRLQRRSGWVEPSEVESYLESLPDVSTKMTTCADAEDGEKRDSDTEAERAAPAPGSARPE